jgi:hypothetical protein
MSVFSEGIAKSQLVRLEAGGIHVRQIIGDDIQPVLLGQGSENGAITAVLHMVSPYQAVMASYGFS